MSETGAVARGDLLRNALAVTAILAFSIAIGYGITAANEAAASELIDFIQKNLFSDLIGEDPFTIFLKIFLNNLEACVLLFLGGASFGLFTLFIISINGALIGVVIGWAARERGSLFILAALLPHGILEIPGFVVAGALGLSLGHALWMELRGLGDASGVMKAHSITFFTRVVPLLVFAAFIESFITPYVVHLIL